MQTEKKILASLQGLSYDDCLSLATFLNLPKFRAEQIYKMAMQYKSYDEVSNLPSSIISYLKENFNDRGVEIVKEVTSKIDGTKKYLFRLADGNLIEGVYMSYQYGNTLCVSTQVGCRMNCAFCASGLDGLIRNLTDGEIMSQVLAVNVINGGTLAERKVTNVVLMGSGEPLDNYDNVISFLKNVIHPLGINISPRNISLSTAGLVPKIYDLIKENIPINLTISLHQTTNEERSAIMPINKSYNIGELMESARYYFDATKRRVIFEYALIKDKNTTEKCARQLVSLLKGFPNHLNLINLNYVKERGLQPSDQKDIREFMAILEENNISVTLRRSMGSDIEGACGQLRRRELRDIPKQPN